ncbi:MAG TPA: rhodanese-like domain-containing protein [Candidatus Acidoferrales bacterium]|nr:rhodanese-like domain-containing protein [Candidatus Acidoferrales bacterium]
MAAPVALEVEVDSARHLIEGGAPLLDVRDADERARLRIAGSLWIPIEELSERWRELPREGTLVVQCAAGSRSFRATKFLREKGLVATSMIGGISEWHAHGLPTLTGSDSGGGSTGPGHSAGPS